MEALNALFISDRNEWIIWIESVNKEGSMNYIRKSFHFGFIVTILIFTLSCSLSDINSGEPIIVDLIDATAFGLTQDTIIANYSLSGSRNSANQRSNLKKIDFNGNLVDLFSSGYAQVNKIYLGPDDKLYILFNDKINLNNSKPDANGSLLAEIDLISGQIKSIDESLDAISWGNATNVYSNNPIQFDSSGAIYYFGSSSGRQILRRYSEGNTFDMINENILVKDFIVLDNGVVFINGSTPLTNTDWIRYIDDSGTVKSLILQTNANSLCLFPDGNLYLQMPDFNFDNEYFYPGIYRFDLTLNQFEKKTWITEEVYPNSTYGEYYGDLNTYGSSIDQIVQDYVTTADGKVFALLDGDLFKFYPQLNSLTSGVEIVTIIEVNGTELYIGGYDLFGNNKLIEYDTVTSSETDLLSGYNIEIYNLSFLPTYQVLMFHGLDFSDNQMVIGSISISSGVVDITEIGNDSSERLVDFIGFD